MWTASHFAPDDAPLTDANTAYTVTITMAPDADQDPQRQVVHTWTFTTTSRALR